MKPLPLENLPPLSAEEEQEAKVRWDKTTFREVKGQWWQYLGKKVKQVFPDLVLPEFDSNATPSTRFSISIPVGR
jgi:hypothetical protein